MPPTKGGRPNKGGAKGAGGKGKRLPQKGAPQKSGGSLVGKKRKSAKRRARWAHYIHKVLKQVHHKKPVGISTKAMTIMGSFVEDMFDRIHNESISIAKINKTKTLTAREVQTGAKLILPGELSKHAMSEGTKAVSKYNTSFVADNQ
jgi:histone H2B